MCSINNLPKLTTRQHNHVQLFQYQTKKISWNWHPATVSFPLSIGLLLLFLLFFNTALSYNALLPSSDILAPSFSACILSWSNFVLQNKSNKFPENPPDISDEWETINLNESDKKSYRYKSVEDKINSSRQRGNMLTKIIRNWNNSMNY